MAPSELPTFLYRAKGRDGSLLYVGITRNVAMRVGKHAADKPWWVPEVKDVTVEMHPTRVAALAAEQRAVKDEAPKYNVTHSDINKPKAPKARTEPRPSSGGPTYSVTARRWRNYWELHIKNVGVTQCRTLLTAEEMARDYVALTLDVDPDTFDLAVVPELDDGLYEAAMASRQAVRDLEVTQRAAAVKLREIARRLKEAGLSGGDIAAVLKVSQQRVSQLVNS